MIAAEKMVGKLTEYEYNKTDIFEKAMKGKRRDKTCHKRVGGRCEPTEVFRYTGPGAFHLNRVERTAYRYSRCPLQEGK